VSLTPSIPATQTSPGTRDQLLAAAAGVFAESGFRSATLRDICQRAGVNVAAVNYHFGGKQELYTEVLRRNYQRALQRFPPEGGVPPDAPAPRRLHGFVRSFLHRILAEGIDSCDGRLLAREMVDPTAALDALVATEIRSLADRLSEIIRALLPKGADERTVRLCLAGVVGQIVFFHHCRPVITRMFPDLQFAASELDDLADHITRFALSGIRGTARRQPPSGARPARPVRR